MNESPEGASVQSFEELLEQLRATVKLLEGNDLTLSEAVAAYERSVTIANECSAILDNAELRISQISTSARVERESANSEQYDMFRATSLLLGEDDVVDDGEEDPDDFWGPE